MNVNILYVAFNKHKQKWKKDEWVLIPSSSSSWPSSASLFTHSSEMQKAKRKNKRKINQLMGMKICSTATIIVCAANQKITTKTIQHAQDTEGLIWEIIKILSFLLVFFLHFCCFIYLKYFNCDWFYLLNILLCECERVCVSCIGMSATERVNEYLNFCKYL